MTAVPDVSEGVVLVAPDKSVSVTIVTAAAEPDAGTAGGRLRQKLHAARVAQNGNYYGLKGMAGDLPLEVCLWTFDGMHGVASIVGRTGHPPCRASWTRWSSTSSPVPQCFMRAGGLCSAVAARNARMVTARPPAAFRPLCRKVPPPSCLLTPSKMLSESL